MYARLTAYAIVGFVLLCTLSGPASARDIVFAVDATYPPMEMLGPDGNITGFAPEIVMAAGAAAGFNPIFQSEAWEGIFVRLAEGKYDAICSSVSITEARKKGMDFSDPYFSVKQGVLARKGSPIKSINDLKGRVLASQTGTTGFFVGKQMTGVRWGTLEGIRRFGLGYFTMDKLPHAEAKAYTTVEEAVEALVQGVVDAVIADHIVAANYALRDEVYSQKLDLAFIVVPETPEYLGFAVQKGDIATRELINDGLKKIRAGGEYEAIYKKWFGAEAPSE